MGDYEIKPEVADMHRSVPDTEEKKEESLGNPTYNENIWSYEDEEDRKFYEKYGTYDRYIICEDDCYDELGFCFPKWKKWMILSVVFIVQVSMNFNTSLYSNAIPGIAGEFRVSDQAARLGAAIFLVTYAFGCELWAPWSEELGRRPILQLSLLFVNIWQIPVGVAPNFGTILVGRALGGLSTAGGSVTLGMVADMWEADVQQYAVVRITTSLPQSFIYNANLGVYSVLVCWGFRPWSDCRWICRTVPPVALEHLDPASLWRFCASSALLLGPGNQVDNHDG
jgi:MFS family permease